MKRKNYLQEGSHVNTPAQKKKEGRKIAPTYVCDELIKCYLKPEQAEYLQRDLRILKKKYQVMLCEALIDYIETGKPVIPEHSMIGAMFMCLTRVNLPDDDKDPRIIRPFGYDDF